MARATFVSGTTDLSRIVVTTESMASVAWLVQSVAVVAGVSAGARTGAVCAMWGHYPRRPMRQPLAVLVGAVIATLGGMIVGEYSFTGWTPYVAGVLFGLVVAEAVVTVARRETALMGAVCAVLAAGGLAYAVWDDAGFGVRPIAAPAW